MIFYYEDSVTTISSLNFQLPGGFVCHMCQIFKQTLKDDTFSSASALFIAYLVKECLAEQWLVHYGMRSLMVHTYFI